MPNSEGFTKLIKDFEIGLASGTVKERLMLMIIAITASEGLSRKEIGRHLWVHLTPIWNMGREGFQRFYEELPGFKPIGFIIKAEEC